MPKLFKLTLPLMILSLIFHLTIAVVPSVNAQTFNLTLNLNKNSFYIREVVEISGNATYGSTPIIGLTALQIGELAFRTIATGNITQTFWSIDVDLKPWSSTYIMSDSMGIFAPINITVKNNDAFPHSFYVSLTVFDAENIALPGAFVIPILNLPGGGSITLVHSQYLPKWVTPGEALACVSIFDQPPASGGIPLRPETKKTFNILNYNGMPINNKANPDSPMPEGSFKTAVRIMPDAFPSEKKNYTVFANMKYSTYIANEQTILYVKYAPYPPIAQFFIIDPYVNKSTTFNAASSSEEGYNHTGITSYTWDFGDGTPPINSQLNHAITHTYNQTGMYITTLNVTANITETEVSWSVLKKPVNITTAPPISGDVNGDGKVDGKDVAIIAKAYNTVPGDPLWDPRADLNKDGRVEGKDFAIVQKYYGTQTPPQPPFKYIPNAVFTYAPGIIYVNQTVTFDASCSSPEGVNDTITNYKWDFGDGTPIQESSTPTIVHYFKDIGTFNVALNITDTEGLWCTIIRPINVKPPEPPIADFTWAPVWPQVNSTTTFDASKSRPGWNGTHEVPIVAYHWDFGDNTNITLSEMIVNHTYTVEGNYTVNLTVIDQNGLQSSISYIVPVGVQPAKPGDVNGDGKVDGKDVAIIAKAYNTVPGDPLWDPRADLNKDGRVEGKDFAIVQKYYGT